MTAASRTFAALLAALRLDRALSQEELAGLSGVSVRTISNLERGTTRAQRATVRALADGLRLTDEERRRLLAAWSGSRTPARPEARERGTLPAPVSSIFGRQRYVSALCRMVLAGPGRLVTVTGPGGVGKSRVAVQAAWNMAERFRRVDAVDASGLRDAEDLGTALAAAVGCPPHGPRSAAAAAARIADAERLVLLESLEHVPDAAASIGYLLERCPKLRLLVTSRSPLGVPGELVSRLAPLPVPGTDHNGLSVLSNPAVAMLVARVTAVRPDFAVTPDNAGALASICRRLDGLPLAIELVAGQLRSQQPAEVDAQLAGRALELRAHVIDVPGRHRTLRATVEWSTERLAGSDRVLLAVLGVFRADAAGTAVVAAAAGAGLGPSTVDEGLDRLAHASLVTVTGRPDAVRVGMLDTVREIAADLLAGTRLGEPVRAAHARYVLDSLVAAAGAPDGFARLDEYVDNVRKAVSDAVARLRRPDRLPAGSGWHGITIDEAAVNALADFHTGRGRFAEAHRTLVAVGGAVTGDCRALALVRAGVAANESGAHRAALDLGRRVLALAATDDQRSMATNLVGSAYKALGDLAAADAAYRACLESATAAGNARQVTIALNNLGTVAHERGEYIEARKYYLRSLQIKQRLGDQRGVMAALVNLGWLSKDMGEYAVAADQLIEAVERSRTLGEPHATAYALALLSHARLGASDVPAATRAAGEAVDIARRIEHPPSHAVAVTALGDIARTLGDPTTAAARYREALGSTSAPFEVARVLVRLAAVDDPGGRAGLLHRAEEICAAAGFALPPADRVWMEPKTVQP